MSLLFNIINQVWFMLMYAALFGGQSLAYICCQLLCSVATLKIFLYLQLLTSVVLSLVMFALFPDRPSQHLHLRAPIEPSDSCHRPSMAARKGEGRVT